MTNLRGYERFMLSMLLAGSDCALANLRAQAEVVAVRERERTPVGEHIYFVVREGVDRLRVPSLVLSDAQATFSHMRHPVQVLLFVENGVLSCLDFESVAGEDWPTEPTFTGSSFLRAEVYPGGGLGLLPCGERDQATLARQLYGSRSAA